jgi:hydrogenase maturation protease
MLEVRQISTSQAPRRTDVAPPFTGRTLVLGLGSPLLRDDAVGLHVVRRLRSLLQKAPGVEVAEDHRGGLHLMERLIGFDRVVIIDAQRSNRSPGTVRVFSATVVPTQHSASAHDVDLPTALELGRRSGAALPRLSDIRVVTVEAADVHSFGEECTAAVAASIPLAAGAVLDLLQAWR